MWYLGPMAGLTNSAYRMHLGVHGAGLVNKRDGLHPRLISRQMPDIGVHPFPGVRGAALAVQLFGDDSPEIMARAAEIVLERATSGGHHRYQHGLSGEEGGPFTGAGIGIDDRRLIAPRLSAASERSESADQVWRAGHREVGSGIKG